MSLTRLFDPRGIAIVGASPEPSRPGAQTLRALTANGYKGGIFPVNPKYHDASDYLQYLVAGRPPRGRNVVVIGGSGGSAVVFSDAADEVGLTLAPPSDQTKSILRDNLPSIASIDNPIDFTAGFLIDSNVPRFERVLDALRADPDIHQVGMLAATATEKNISQWRDGARATSEAFR